MSEEQREKEEQQVKEDEEDKTDTNLQPGGDAEEQPPEVDREPGSNREGLLQAGRSTTDVLETVEEAESQADMPDEHLREPQGRENVENSTATGRVVEDQKSLMELGVQPHGSTRMEMSSADPTTHPLRPLRPPEHDNMPDVITVRVQTGEDMFQEVVVEIERPPQQKAYLGGYRHRLTGVQYHHAAVQTLPKRRPDRGVVVFSRNTQTVKLKSQAQQCPVNASTQMTGIGCYVSCMNDKLVSPGSYITADEYHDTRLNAVIVLQSFARRWLARQEVNRLKRDRDRRLAWLELQETRRREEKEEQLRDRRQRWMSPQRREDFNLLYQALESRLRGAERKAALCSLLEQETQLIAAIGRHRIAVQDINYDKTVRNFLDKSAAPHQWRAADGGLIEMDSPHTIRARQLRDLYNSTSLSTVSQEQRLHVLMTLKHTVMEHKCQLTRDMVDLIDREVDLMTRGVKAASLEGLRRRISTLFLQYIKTPAFNPEVAKLLKVPQNPSQLKNNMFLCRGCNRYLHSADFKPSASAEHQSRCRDCTRLDNIARSRHDFSCYKHILRRLRADEQRLNQEAKIPFLLQVVWASCSALHGSKDLYSLVFVRWNRQKDWSPWNCILLSKEETSAHLEVEDVHKAYDATFIRRIEHKHTLARRHFSQMAVMAEYLDPHLSAALGNHLVSKPVTMATGRPTIATSPASAH
ncbi:hypothetical protein FQN60_014349 [Etheostoma spectabile]|uniref:IQ motif and ubiquitin-like domain-containing protein n=1 Tax=Etheostoma spectabile TaxID=54343 RepID=A0A5J5DC63_9PERO|nr:hypothetical protein FQN60_014349 [Etheostoma spectabile]